MRAGNRLLTMCRNIEGTRGLPMRFPPMKTIVYVKLPAEAKERAFDPEGPFMVIAPQPGRSGVYEDEPDVISQIPAGETDAKFEAEWVNGEWVFGRRTFDA
jgi:hypothetical protein